VDRRLVSSGAELQDGRKAGCPAFGIYQDMTCQCRPFWRGSHWNPAFRCCLTRVDRFNFRQEWLFAGLTMAVLIGEVRWKDAPLSAAGNTGVRAAVVPLGLALEMWVVLSTERGPVGFWFHVPVFSLKHLGYGVHAPARRKGRRFCNMPTTMSWHLHSAGGS